MKIEILGGGCQNCKKLEENAKKAVQELGLKAEIVKITQIERIAEYGVISTPALVLDGVVVFYGRVPSVSDIKGAFWGK